jgi:hypothetical protein
VEKLESLLEATRTKACPRSAAEVQECFPLFNVKGYDKLGNSADQKFSCLEDTVQVLREWLRILDEHKKGS